MVDQNAELLRKLDDFLDSEHAALQMGEISEVAARSGLKEDLFTQIETLKGRIDAGRFQPVLHKVKRNQKLLASASDGLRSALLRISELQKLSAGGGTYAADGSRSANPARSNTLWKRR